MGRKIPIVINGKQATGDEGETILAVAKRLGTDIPTLCHHEELNPSGNCRICVVELEGSSRLVASCHTPIEAGMVIHTDSPKVRLSRKITLELLIGGHTGSCVLDPQAESCELHEIGSRVELGPPRFLNKNPRYYPVEEDNPYVIRDLSKCILCRRCLSACDEIAQQSLFSVGYRGFEAKIIVGADRPLDAQVCRDCGICVDFCPTSALRRSASEKEGAGKKVPKNPVKKAAHCEGILAELKKEQLASRVVSEAAMTRIADRFKTSLSEVYGLTSFYSFLYTESVGRHLIRVCNNLPCFLKNSLALLNGIKAAIGIGPGETTEDGRFSLQLTNCIGACDQAPAIMVDYDIHGGLREADIPGILESYK